MFGVFYVDIYRQPPFSRIRGISGLEIYEKIIPDSHHHHIFVIDATVYVLILVDSTLEEIVIAHHVVVDLKPFLFFECENM
jgi:hypothetical protein